MPPSSDRLTTRQRAFLLAGLLALAAGLAFFGWIRGTTAFDDPFITYTYAASLARGDGLTWNGAPGLGTSTPFLAVVLGALEFLVPLGVPVWGAALYWFSVGVAALALLAIGRREGWPAGAAFAAAALSLQLFVHAHVGSEMLPALAAVLVAALLLGYERWLAAGLVLALAVALRAETSVAVLALAAAFLGRFRSDGKPVLRPLARVGGAFVAAIALWSAALYALAGAIVPATLAAKRAQAASELQIWRSGIEVFGAAWRNLPRQLLLLDGKLAGLWIAAGLALGAAGLALSRPAATPARLALIAWGPLQLGLVAALDVAFYPWYAIPFCFSATLLAAQAVEGPWIEKARAAISRRPIDAAARAALGGAAGAATILLATSHFGWQVDDSRGDPRRVAYEQVADLARSLPAGTTVGAYEVGYLGLRSGLPVLDLLGLVTSEVALANVESGDLHANLELLRPDLLMLPLRGGSLFGRTVGDPERFVGSYRIERLQLGPGTPLVVFRRAEAPTSGEVVLDLLPLLRAAGAKILGRELDYSVLVARIPGGSSVTLALPGPLPASRFVAGYAQGDGGARRISWALDPDPETDGPGEIRSRREPAGDRWKAWTEEWPPLPSGATLTFQCTARAAGSCDLALPHLQRLALRDAP